VLGGICLLLIELNSPSIFISFGCAVLVSVLIIFLNRRLLNVADMFPELRRLPLTRLFFPDNEAAL
jgi:hypothetical protein